MRALQRIADFIQVATTYSSGGFNRQTQHTLALLTNSQLYQFFRELAKPFDPNQPPSAPTPEAMQQLFEVAANYGYWLGSPAENAASGLNMV